MKTHEIIATLAELWLTIEDSEERLARATEDADDYAAQDATTMLADAMERLETLLSDDLPDKLEGLLAYIEESKAQERVAKAKAAEWRDIAGRRARRVERVTGLAMDLIDANGGPVRMDGGRQALIRERRSMVVEVPDVDVLAGGYTRITKAADKVKIKRAIEAGITVPGASLVESVSRSIGVKDR